jgi:hypothetical protein
MGKGSVRSIALSLLLSMKRLKDSAESARNYLLTRPLEIQPRDSLDGQAYWYINECTLPSDRFLVTRFEPRFIFYSERLGAGGRTMMWELVGADSVFPETRVVSLLGKQSVPIVFVDTVIFEPVFKSTWPLVSKFIEDITSACRSRTARRQFSWIAIRCL